MKEVQELRYQEIPDNKLRSKGISSWTPTDVRFLLVGALVAIAVAVWCYAAGFGYEGAALFGFLTALGVVGLLIRLPNGDARFYGTIALGSKSLRIIFTYKNYLWVSDAEEKRIKAEGGSTGGRRAHRMRAKHPALPLSFGVVSGKLEEKDYRYTLIHQRDRPLDHLYIFADGGNFVSKDADPQFQAIDELAAILNQIISQSDLRCTICYGFNSGPDDKTGQGRYLRLNMDPTISRPDQFELSDDERTFNAWLFDDARQLVPLGKAFGASKNWSMIVITIRRDWGSRSARKGRASSQELYDLPIIELGRDLVEALTSSATLGLKNVRIPGLAELSCMVRCSWDVVGIEQYFKDRAGGRIPTTDKQIDEIFDTAGAAAVEAAQAKCKKPLSEAVSKSIYEKAGGDAATAALQCWPRKLVAVSSDGCKLRMDDNWIIVKRVKRLPERTRADQFQNLHHVHPKGVWVRNAMVGEAVSGSLETHSSIYHASFLANFQQVVAGNRVIQNPSWERKKRQQSNMIEQISLNSVAQHFNMPRAVVAGSERDAERGMRKVSSALQTRGFMTKPFDLQAEQVDAYISSCLCIPRL